LKIAEIWTVQQLMNLIIEIELKKLYAPCGLGYKLTLSEKAKAFIAEKGFDKQFGARPLKEPFKIR
jgi:ATP-dependent Clp protease ATP-binding subunit ClpC